MKSHTTAALVAQLDIAHAEASLLTAFNLIHGAFLLLDARLGAAEHSAHDAENWAVRDIINEATDRLQEALNAVSRAKISAELPR